LQTRTRLPCNPLLPCRDSAHPNYGWEVIAKWSTKWRLNRTHPGCQGCLTSRIWWALERGRLEECGESWQPGLLGYRCL
jgi:hypothetical protein